MIPLNVLKQDSGHVWLAEVEVGKARMGAWEITWGTCHDLSFVFGCWQRQRFSSEKSQLHIYEVCTFMHACLFSKKFALNISGDKLNKHMQGLFTGKYRILLRDRKRPTKRRNIKRPWNGRLIVLKMTFIPKFIYIFNVIPNKIPVCTCRKL